jgi:putative ABC transport system permease protein
MLTIFWNDVKYAIRQLVKTPGFTLTAILTLALGIGVNAAMFSVIDQVLLRPLPYANADRLVRIGGQPDSGRSAMSLPDAQDFAARSHTLQGVAYYSFKFTTLGGTDHPEMTPQVVSSTNLFDILGVRPMLGRNFVSDDSKAGRNNVLLLSYGLWRDQFHSDKNIVGRPVKLNGDPYTVIGVLPQATGFPGDSPDGLMYSPIDVSDKAMNDRGSSGLAVIGLLRPGMHISQARAELNGIREQLQKEYPKDESKDPIGIVDYRAGLRGYRCLVDRLRQRGRTDAHPCEWPSQRDCDSLGTRSQTSQTGPAVFDGKPFAGGCRRSGGPGDCCSHPASTAPLPH